MNDPEQRRTLWHWLKSVVRADVVLLQETLCASQDAADRWIQEWCGLSPALHPLPLSKHAFFSISTTSRTGGTAILLSKTFAQQAQLQAVQYDELHNGAWTSLTLGYDKKQFQIDSVYLPVDGDLRVAAIPLYISACTPPVDTLHISAGDYNCVAAVWRDVRSTSRYSNEGGELLTHHMEDLHMVDAWTQHCPDRAGFTLEQRHTNTKTRIDRFYVHSSLTAEIENVAVTFTPHITDHHALRLKLKFGPEKMKSAYWRLNSSILTDPSTQLLIETTWEWWLTQRGVTPLLHWWVQWKEMMGTMLMTQSETLAAQRRAALKKLQEEYKTSLDAEQRFMLREELTEYLYDRAEKAQLKAGAHREVLGDRPTAQFFAQAHIRARKSKICQLTTSTGEVISEQKVMDEHTTAFWGTTFGEHLRDTAATVDELAATA